MKTVEIPADQNCCRTSIKKYCFRTSIKRICCRTSIKRNYCRTLSNKLLQDIYQRNICRTSIKRNCFRTSIKILFQDIYHNIVSGHLSKEVGALVSGMQKASGGGHRLPPPKHPGKQDPWGDKTEILSNPGVLSAIKSLCTKYFQGMTRKPSHSKAGPVSQEQRPQGHPLPALPLPKRPATKPDVTRKPPAVAPDDDQSAPIMGLSDKTSHYSNVSSQSKKTAATKNHLALPLAPSIQPPNNHASSPAPSAPKQSSQRSTPQVSSEAGKQAHSSAPKPRSEPAPAPKSSAPTLSPPNLLSPIPGNLSTNPFLDLIQTEDTVKSISQSFSGENPNKTAKKSHFPIF